SPVDASGQSHAVVTLHSSPSKSAQTLARLFAVAASGSKDGVEWMRFQVVQVAQKVLPMVGVAAFQADWHVAVGALVAAWASLLGDVQLAELVDRVITEAAQ